MNEKLRHFQQVLEAHFGGALAQGQHYRNAGRACALELVSSIRGTMWTDDPEILDMPDIRPINDAIWSDNAVRTRNVLPVLAAYDDWASWTEERRRRVVERIVIGTARRILPAALRVYGQDAQADLLATAETVVQATDTNYNPSVPEDLDLRMLAEWARQSRPDPHITWAAAQAAAYIGTRAVSKVYAAIYLDGERRFDTDTLLAELCRVWLDAVEEEV